MINLILSEATTTGATAAELLPDAEAIRVWYEMADGRWVERDAIPLRHQNQVSVCLRDLAILDPTITPPLVGGVIPFVCRQARYQLPVAIQPHPHGHRVRIEFPSPNPPH